MPIGLADFFIKFLTTPGDIVFDPFGGSCTTGKSAELLRRKWIITNGFGEIEIVEGEGVVGKQPLLYPGDNYEYISGAVIDTPFGVMKGLYYFQNIHTDEEFIVKVPEFKLETLELLN
jgi:ApaG protein